MTSEKEISTGCSIVPTDADNSGSENPNEDSRVTKKTPDIPYSIPESVPLPTSILL